MSKKVLIAIIATILLLTTSVWRFKHQEKTALAATVFTTTTAASEQREQNKISGRINPSGYVQSGGRAVDRVTLLLHGDEGRLSWGRRYPHSPDHSKAAS